MARMHARRRGSSGSKKPLVKEKPAWVTMDAAEIEGLVVKLIGEGKNSAVVGLILRDQYAIPSVKIATGKTISQILKEKKLNTRLPEDMQNLMKRAVSLNEHVKKNPKDLHNKRGLNLIESKIRRLAKYYGREGMIPEGWKYSLDTAKLEIE
jgi:small subunit ribosomal protein S15